MQKKILLAVDGSTPSRQAVDYAGRMNNLIQGLGVTLFHLQPPISQFLLDEAKRSGQAQAELKKIAARNAEASRGLLAGYRETLIRAGLAEPAVELATQPRNQGLAKDILDYAQNGLFDAILVGRRGISAVQQMFMGSVSAHLIENSPVIPVWLVDGNVRSTRVMAAVDGSESALRAVDHMAFMLSGNPEVRFCFFHVTPRLKDYCEINFGAEAGGGLETLIAQGDQRCMDDFFPRRWRSSVRRASATSRSKPGPTRRCSASARRSSRPRGRGASAPSSWVVAESTSPFSAEKCLMPSARSFPMRPCGWCRKKGVKKPRLRP